MFWSSVRDGLYTFLDWKVLGIILLCFIAHSLFLMFVGGIIGNGENKTRETKGCLTLMFGGLFIEAIILSLAIFFLMPILLGGNGLLPIEALGILFWPVLKAGLIAVFIVLILTVLPIIGRVISGTPGLTTFLQALIIFRIFSSSFIDIYVEQLDVSSASLYPGFWHTIGYALVAFIFVSIALAVIHFVRETYRKRTMSSTQLLIERLSPQRPEPTGFDYFIGQVIMRILGFLPLFMYASYVVLQLQSKFGNYSI